jgi:hypothetical protein
MGRRRETGFDLFAWRHLNDIEARRREIAAQVRASKPNRPPPRGAGRAAETGDIGGIETWAH